MTLISSKFLKGIELAKTLDDIYYLREKLETTSQINRRTKDGRKLSKELETKIAGKEELLIANGAVPFN